MWLDGSLPPLFQETLQTLQNVNKNRQQCIEKTFKSLLLYLTENSTKFFKNLMVVKNTCLLWFDLDKTEKMMGATKHNPLWNKSLAT